MAMYIFLFCFLFFFFNDTATTEIYTLSLHDALPILYEATLRSDQTPFDAYASGNTRDRKSTRLNSSHDQISYAVFCLKKKIQESLESGRDPFDHVIRGTCGAGGRL